MLYLNVVVAMLSEQAHEESLDRLATIKRTLSPDLQPAQLSGPINTCLIAVSPVIFIA